MSPPWADVVVVEPPSLDDGPSLGQVGEDVFVQAGAMLDDALKARIRARLKAEGSPRHVYFETPAIPFTLTGKTVEIPVRKLLLGAELAQATSRDAMTDPDAIDWFVTFVESLRNPCGRKVPA